MKSDLFNLIPYTFNKILENQPGLADEFSIYKGKIILIDLSNTSTMIYILMGDKGMEIANQPVEKPDLMVRATPLELIQYFFQSRSQSVPSSGEIELTGNIGLAQKIQNVFMNLDFDLEDAISKVIGDEFSHGLFFTFRKFVENINYGKQELANNFAEILKYEKDIVIDNAEVRRFNQSVDQLRDEVDKLDFRIKRISSTLEAS